METELLHADVTGKIIGAEFEVYRVPGYDFLESVTQRAIQVEITRFGLPAETEAPLKVKHRDVIVGG